MLPGKWHEEGDLKTGYRLRTGKRKEARERKGMVLKEEKKRRRRES